MTGGTLLSGLLLSFDGVDSLPASPAERAQLQYVPWFGLGLQESAPGSEWEAAMHDKLYAPACRSLRARVRPHMVLCACFPVVLTGSLCSLYSCRCTAYSVSRLL